MITAFVIKELSKWLSVRVQTQWLRVRIPLQSLKLQRLQKE